MNIIVVGYFGKFNLGDELFKEAFHFLFPEHIFTFTDFLTSEQVSKSDAVFFGGGSYLDGAPFGQMSAFDRVLEKPFCYIGVGAETAIHQSHKKLMEKAKLVAIRTPKQLTSIKAINTNTIAIPDIVCAFGSKTKFNRLEKSLLFAPNIYVVPRYNDPHYKHTAFSRFKCEMAQVLDQLVDDGWLIRFFPFSTGEQENDLWCAQEIINHMKHRGSNYMAGTCANYEQLNNKMSDFELVITQRYHGIIAAELSLTPYISLAHHDKLRQGFLNTGSFVNYYEVSKVSLLDAIEKSKRQSVLKIKGDVFDELKKKVKEALGQK